jgi:hypothetical protein
VANKTLNYFYHRLAKNLGIEGFMNPRIEEMMEYAIDIK